jgi:hypothetical protein
MRHPVIKLAVVCTAALLAATGIAWADCESDMFQLEAAMKTPNLSPDAKAGLDDAATKATEAMKKDDDTRCHKAIADGMAKAGLTLK